jgi:hypothetical protein
MPLFANGISLTDKLRDPLSAINSGSQDKLSLALGAIGDRQRASNRAVGRTQGSYAPAELSRATQTASTGLKDKLLGALGDASYSEYKKNRDHQRNMALVNEIGDLSAPSILEQILGGLGGGAKAGGEFYSLYNSLNKRPSVNTARPNLSMNDFYDSEVA